MASPRRALPQLPQLLALATELCGRRAHLVLLSRHRVARRANHGESRSSLAGGIQPPRTFGPLAA